MLKRSFYVHIKLSVSNIQITCIDIYKLQSALCDAFKLNFTFKRFFIFPYKASKSFEMLHLKCIIRNAQKTSVRMFYTQFTFDSTFNYLIKYLITKVVKEQNVSWQQIICAKNKISSNAKPDYQISGSYHSRTGVLQGL